ncbi:MAG: hypothetical protein KF745_14805 [Phycisphaeraceae bacterium]|nr:hypothetical protein [Phycisphaeraceae bacterium]
MPRHTRTTTMARLLAPAIAALVGACAATPEARLAAAREADEPPPDFSIALTIPTVPDPNVKPGRYILQPDWVLRVTPGAAVAETTYPALTRQLTHAQAERVWWDVRDSVLLEPDHPGRVGAYVPVPAEDGTIKPMVLVSYTAAGVRRTYVLDPAALSAEDRAVLKRLALRLSALAWLDTP